MSWRAKPNPYVVCVNINAHDSTLLSAVYFQVCKFTHPTELKGPRLREIAPTATGSQDTGSHNLAHAYEAWVTDANKNMFNLHPTHRSLPNPGPESSSPTSGSTTTQRGRMNFVQEATSGRSTMCQYTTIRELSQHSVYFKFQP